MNAVAREQHLDVVPLDGDTQKKGQIRDTHRERRNELLAKVDRAVIQKAWFTLSHLLLDKGAVVADMGCDDGAMAFCMAAMNPDITVIGVDRNKRQINKAREKYRLDNLKFEVGEAAGDVFGASSLDAIINSFVLHEVYSGSRYNERIVSDTLRKQFQMLKKGGTMFVRDFARPPPGNFVMLEMPDKPSFGESLDKLSEADLLVWYSQHAQPKQDPGCGGFFLEELPARLPGTRLFRLPHKWAYEFIMRKDDRARWETELPMEYTFFTMREFRKELIALGARVQYAAPHWDEDELAAKMGDPNKNAKVRIYSDEGELLDPPATSYVVVARKMAERKSLNIEERRPSSSTESSLRIEAMRNEKTGELVDVVKRDFSMSEIIPYRITQSGRIKICLHDGVARGIANAVPRLGVNLDGKRWSGHMVEAIGVDDTVLREVTKWDVKNTVRIARDYVGVKPKAGGVMESGPDYYPAPDYIDDHINTYYMEAEKLSGPALPKGSPAHNQRFLAKGEIREFDAQNILDAITVGMIPNARLELQILSLFQHLGIKAESWTMKQVQMKRGKITGDISVRNVLKHLSNRDHRFKAVRGSAGQLRSVHSFFVEEGQVSGARSGLSAQDMDFVVPEGKTINTVVVLPITFGMKNDVHAGFQLSHMPVPQRHEGSGATISAPSFNLPAHIATLQQTKKFIAEKFGVLPEMVIKMGESYYNHIGFTPQKIHPFAVAAPPDMFKDPNTSFLPLFNFMYLWKDIKRAPHFMTLIARAWKYLPGHLKLEARRSVDVIVAQRFASGGPDWSVPVNYKLAPTIQDLPPAPEEKPEALPPTQTAAPVAATPAPEKPAALPVEPKTKQEKPEEEKAAPKIEAPPQLEPEVEEFLEDVRSAETEKPRPEKW